MKRFFVLTFVLVFIANVCFANLKITMLNVGQGDSFLIQTDTQNILIDTSDVDERAKLISELAKAKVSVINKLILTHSHADHIGSALYLLKNYGVQEVYDNGFITTSKYAANYRDFVNDNYLKYETLRKGDTLDLGGGVTFEVYHPSNKTGYSVNNQSIVGKLVYEDFAMIFTGDAENEALTDIVYHTDNLKAQILKAGHHGSKTSALVNFNQAVKPDYVLISAGEQTKKRGGNTYGHPHADALFSYIYAGVKPEHIFWSWANGTVVIESDGGEYSIKTENSADWITDYLKGKQGTITTATKLL